MRLKTELWVKSYLRQRQAAGAFAAVVVHGHDDAGAILIKVNRLDGTASLWGPSPVSFSDTVGEMGERTFARMHDEDWIAERAVDDIVARQRSYDEDIWVLEVEDADGAHGLDGWLATPAS